MQKKIITFGVILVCVLIILSIIILGKGENTIEEALNVDNKHSINILHQEEVSNGVVVFYNKPNKDNLHAHYIKKKLIGWEYVYGGVQSDVSLGIEKRGFVVNSFSKVKNTPFPMLYGIVGDSEISKIRVIGTELKREYEAKIVGENNIWILFMEEFDEESYDIIGVSEDDVEMSRFTYSVN